MNAYCQSIMIKTLFFFFFRLFYSSAYLSSNREPWKNQNDTAENNERARKAFEAVLTVTAWTPDTEEYMNFSKEVKERAKTKYNYTYEEDTVNTFVTGKYIVQTSLSISYYN